MRAKNICPKTFFKFPPKIYKWNFLGKPFYLHLSYRQSFPQQWLANKTWKDDALHVAVQPAGEVALAEVVCGLSRQGILLTDSSPDSFTTATHLFQVKKKITRELVTTILARKPKMCAFLEYKEMKIVYKRWAYLLILIPRKSLQCRINSATLLSTSVPPSSNRIMSYCVWRSFIAMWSCWIGTSGAWVFLHLVVGLFNSCSA